MLLSANAGKRRVGASGRGKAQQRVPTGEEYMGPIADRSLAGQSHRVPRSSISSDFAKTGDTLCVYQSFVTDRIRVSGKLNLLPTVNRQESPLG